MSAPGYRKTNNPNNTDTFNRRVPAPREMDNDHRSNAEADKDYYDNLKKFNGSRCEDQTANPNRKMRPQT